MAHPPVPAPPTPIALQLWTVRQALAADLDGTLAQVRAAGFAAVEVAPLPPGLPPERLADALSRHELAVVSIHGDLPAADNIGEWDKLTRLFANSRIIWHGWPRDPRFDSSAGVRDLVADCNRAGEIARDQGFMLGLHNHWWEFEPLAGERPIQLLHDGLHPEIFWQLDVYWAHAAGADPATVLKTLGGRVQSIHWKDGPAVVGEPMTALGQGVVDLPNALRAVSRPIDWVIELDECATDPLEAAGQSLAYLKGMQD